MCSSDTNHTMIIQMREFYASLHVWSAASQGSDNSINRRLTLWPLKRLCSAPTLVWTGSTSMQAAAYVLTRRD